MALTNAQLTALKSEIQTDPVALGYTGKSHEDIADLINRPVRAGLFRESISAGMIVASVVKSEFLLLTANDRLYFVDVLLKGGDNIPVTSTLRTEFAALFGAGSQTRANLTALIRRQGSRVEELSLPRVITSDVADALRS